MHRWFVGFGLSAGLIACAPQPPHATAFDAERSQIGIGQLEEGRGLLLQKCGNCHRAPLPNQHLATDWPSKLDEMAERSKLDLRQRQMIEQYLVVMASAGERTARR